MTRLRRLEYKLLLSIWFMGISASLSLAQIPEPYSYASNKGLVFDTEFQYRTHQVSGLLVVRRERDDLHLVLLSKLGPTVFDVVMEEKALRWKKKMEVLDKPSIRKVMERDFRVLFLTPLHNPVLIKEKGDNRWMVRKRIKIKITTGPDGKVIAAENRKFFNLFKSFVKYFYEENDPVPQKIKLRHRNIKLKMTLNRLDR